MGYALGQAIREQMDRDAAESAARKKAEAERKEQLRLQLEAERQRQAEASKQRLLVSMKGADTTPSLSLDNMKVLSLKDPVLQDPEHLAAGRKIVDCKAANELQERMSKGLNTQYEALQKTLDQLKVSEHRWRQLTEEERNVLIKGTLKTGAQIAKLDPRFRQEFEELKGLTPEKKKQLLAYLARADTWQQRLEKAPKAYKAGYKFGREELANVGNEIEITGMELWTLLTESGIADEGAKEIVAWAFGPQWKIMYTALKGVADEAAITYEQTNTEEEMARARDNLNALHWQVSRANEAIDNAKADIAEYCSAKSTAVTTGQPLNLK